jgi:hypothetical protein
MNMYGAMVDRYRQAKAQVLGEKHVPVTLGLSQIPFALVLI